MGNSLHNKIYLGRRSVLASRRLRVVLGMSVLVSIGLLWMLMRGLN